MKTHLLFKDQTNSFETAEVYEDVVRMDFVLSPYEKQDSHQLTRVFTLENAKRLRKFLDGAIKQLEGDK